MSWLKTAIYYFHHEVFGHYPNWGDPDDVDATQSVAYLAGCIGLNLTDGIWGINRTRHPGGIPFCYEINDAIHKDDQPDTNRLSATPNVMNAIRRIKQAIDDARRIMPDQTAESVCLALATWSYKFKRMLVAPLERSYTGIPITEVSKPSPAMWKALVRLHTPIPTTEYLQMVYHAVLNKPYDATDANSLSTLCAILYLIAIKNHNLVCKSIIPFEVVEFKLHQGDVYSTQIADIISDRDAKSYPIAGSSGEELIAEAQSLRQQIGESMAIGDNNLKACASVSFLNDIVHETTRSERFRRVFDMWQGTHAPGGQYADYYSLVEKLSQ